MPRADQGFSLPEPAAAQADPEAIARRAYELYLQRGGEPGHETEDWLQAEAELTQRSESAAGNRADSVKLADGDIGNGLDGKADGRPSPATSSPGSSSAGASGRKGNGSRRQQRQPQSH